MQTSIMRLFIPIIILGLESVPDMERQEKQWNSIRNNYGIIDVCYTEFSERK